MTNRLREILAQDAVENSRSIRIELPRDYADQLRREGAERCLMLFMEREHHARKAAADERDFLETRTKAEYRANVLREVCAEIQAIIRALSNTGEG